MTYSEQERVPPKKPAQVIGADIVYVSDPSPKPSDRVQRNRHSHWEDCQLKIASPFSGSQRIKQLLKYLLLSYQILIGIAIITETRRRLPRSFGKGPVLLSWG